ncbi:proline iminopeptidase [Laetiporus sulphureus 93-53]|uniref:Proline iminopeptidase n=1 Tax=Laetiporus sulphureus 93-53 TaxID=1314785 RepID=A0A165BWR0_9APHY|nr:proline iminopeptidase [Laetiporus sulphureus 93-53]KZT01792.1 proline iminopeptidase [Laetiporus sulphureus 93-53]
MIVGARLCSTLLALFTTVACFGAIATASSPVINEGTVPFVYEGETYHTYYKIFGNISTSSRSALVVLHGGPGLSHDYLLPIAELATYASVPVIFYDQIGGARSTHLREKDPSFWSIDLFLDELMNLILHFAVQDSFDLLGHSWGGVLGAEYAVRKQPEGLKHLILSNTLASSELWGRSTAQLMQAFPEDVQQGIIAGMVDPNRFGEAMRKFNQVHGCTVRPMPKEFMYSFEQIFGKDGDTTVASAPILQDWSIIDRLHRIRVPTLVINGGSDIAQDFVVAPFYQYVPDARWITFENSSHTPFWEERERYLQVVGNFLALE